MIDPIDLSESALRRILWQAMEPMSTQELLGHVSDRDPILRTMAAKQLHFRPVREVFCRAVELTESVDSVEREIGCFILAQLGTPDFPFAAASMKSLVRVALNDTCIDARAAAVAALGHLGHPDGLDTVLQAAADAAPEVRQMAAFSLGSFDFSRVESTLASLLDDPDPGVREWAQAWLDEFSGDESSGQP